MEVLLWVMMVTGLLILAWKGIAWLYRRNSQGLAETSPAPLVKQAASIPPAARVDHPQPAPPSWIPPGQAVEVAGYRISGGMIYLGTGLPSVGGHGTTEPALIDPRLPVDHRSPDRAGALMPYWPSYCTIPPASRAAYLEWLSGGRCDPSTGIGHVFMFFYGLERRALVDAARSEDARSDLTTIVDETTRLLGLYDSSASFRAYGTAFLEILKGLLHPALPQTAPPSRAIVPGFEFPLSIRVALGELSLMGKPIPAEWALVWYRAAPATRLRTPAQRCPDELERLFAIRYAQRFGEGLAVKPNRTIIHASYRPASSSFGGRTLDIPLAISQSKAGVPDVTALQGPLTKITEIAEACVTDLEPYSRWVGRNPELRSTPAAVALLPSELVGAHESPAITALCGAVEARLGASNAAPIPFVDLIENWHVAQGGPLRKADAILLVQLLQKRGYGLEPDPRFGGSLPAADRTGVVFRLPDGAPSALSAPAAAATLTIQLAVAVAAADENLSPAEIGELEDHLVTALPVTAQERARLRAHLMWLMVETPSIAGLKKRIAALDATQRQGIGEFVVSIATADGRVTPSEVSSLTKIFKLLQLDPGGVYGMIHALSTPDSASADPAVVPVTVKPPSKPSAGFAIPRATDDLPPSVPGVTLDMARVEAKLAQSAAVSALLSSIFVDEEEQAPALAQSDQVDGLDLAHSAFLRALARQAEWPRGDLESLAAEFNVLPDGAVDAVNEYAIERAGEPLCDGDDPIVVNRDLIKELTP